jgi:hypothetical protein
VKKLFRGTAKKLREKPTPSPRNRECHTDSLFISAGRRIAVCGTFNGLNVLTAECARGLGEKTLEIRKKAGRIVVRPFPVRFCRAPADGHARRLRRLCGFRARLSCFVVRHAAWRIENDGISAGAIWHGICVVSMKSSM